MVKIRSDKSAGCRARPRRPASLVCPPSALPLCEEVARRHAGKLAICDRLEVIADSLPGSVDRHSCLAVAADLLPLLREAQAFEERKIFSAYADAGGGGGSLDRLRAEHVEDEAAAEELTEALLRVGHGAAVNNPEALGFMLRAFFEGLRRHIAFEREHVVPIALRRTAGGR